MPQSQRFVIDYDFLRYHPLAPGHRVAGIDDTVSVELPGPPPWHFAHVDASGVLHVIEGVLWADAPLRFLNEDGVLRAVSFDDSVVYGAHLHVGPTEPWWSATPPSDHRSGSWSSARHTLWRAAPGALKAGLLRAVSGQIGDWSVLDWHLPNSFEPVWRIVHTEGAAGLVAAAVSPTADQLVVVLADPKGTDTTGKDRVQALATKDGHTLWTVELEGHASNWRSTEGRLSYSADGARVALLVQDRARCASCNAIAVFDSRTGKRLHRVSLQQGFLLDFTFIGLTGDEVWAFEHVPRKDSDMRFSRPRSCQYEVHDLSTGARRTLEDTATEWGMKACTTWALLPRYDKEGVVGLGIAGRDTLIVLRADRAP